MQQEQKHRTHQCTALPARPCSKPYSCGPCVQWQDALSGGHLKQPPRVSAASYRDTSFSIRNLMQFDGPAPELINGRAAMLGFVAALFMEIYTGKPVLEQAIEEPRCILVAFTLILVASLYPMGKNATPQTEQHTIFKAEAEIWGGRAACVPSAATLSSAVCCVRAS